MSLGAIRKYVPEDFGENAPSIFRRLAVRNVAKVSEENLRKSRGQGGCDALACAEHERL
jgi:hypothetical protein